MICLKLYRNDVEHKTDHDMNEPSQLSLEVMLQAIMNSGYLMECEIANSLSKDGFFIETNRMLEDPNTGKSREIDLIAEYYDRNDQRVWEKNVCAKIEFIFEIKNNIYPLVLMNKYDFSPNIEIWESIKEIQTPKDIEWGLDNYYDKISIVDEPIFTQYCSFDKKKTKDRKIIAKHSEQLHAGFSKIVQYCEEAVESWQERKEADGYFRKFMFLPALVINEDLYELEIRSGEEPLLHKTEESKLLFSYHFKNRPEIATIWIVTKKGFENFIQRLIRLERTMEAEMIQYVRKIDNK